MVADPKQYMRTSGETDAVWIHTNPYSSYPKFSKLDRDLETDVCIVGSGISGVSIAYELVTRGINVVMIEAREIISGETGRTSGHLANDLDDGYTEIAKKHGDEGAKAAAESHTWALNRVGEISKQLGIECEYRKLPSYDISQYPRNAREHANDMKQLVVDGKKASELGIKTEYKEGFAVKGWTGAIDQRDAVIYPDQATFHPTKYLVGVLKFLQDQPNFSCYTYTRAMDVEEKGIEVLGMDHKDVYVKTIDGHTIKCQDAVEATVIPLQKLSVVAEEEYYRTYCIAIRVPKGSVEDCLLYDSAETYKYIRFTECDDKDDYMVVGGGDHKVGQGDTIAPFAELEKWTRDRFPQAGKIDYKWSGQVFEPVDYMAFIGKNQGKKHTYIVTGDSGNGLTHGVLAGKLIADEITNTPNPWAKLYNPSRLSSIAKTLPSLIQHDVQINAQYKRFLQTDINDIEDLVPGDGGVLNATGKKPIACYKDENGQVHKFSAICPHLHGVVCWNSAEKSWDCPVHGSRFSKDGVQIIGPAKAGLTPENDSGEKLQKRAIEI
ncbi:FAD dependent oxidoreductase [Bimuria novae-zelandiae CBS 107.79]|uniref:FAD dependent oxidoreductase n=1 Tax=Bimuria novae-zelandiae CBS 107.79 TaxID=1447943 RepID=A0A6A5UQ62_9PLEO|nr:FAD dependent oxidoreductase [Bimuria novae-zelandiae CBS 107.79]